MSGVKLDVLKNGGHLMSGVKLDVLRDAGNDVWG